MYTTKNEIYFLVAPLRGGKQSLLCNSLLCNSLLCNSLLCARRNERSYKKGFYKTFFNFSHKNSIHWIFMRELAPCRIKIKSCRIKIQLIEFLCENSPILSPPPHGGGLTNLRLWFNFIATGGAQIGEMAEGSQICDFLETTTRNISDKIVSYINKNITQRSKDQKNTTPLRTHKYI